MPIDLSNFLNQYSNYFSTNSELKYVLSSPFLLGVIITTVIIMIFHWRVKVTPSVVLYMLAGFSFLIFIHDEFLLRQTPKKATDVDFIKNQLSQKSIVQPREELVNEKTTDIPPTVGGLAML